MKTICQDSLPSSLIASSSTWKDVEEAIKPLREVADSLQGWLVRVGTFLEPAEAALQGSLLHRLPWLSLLLASWMRQMQSS